MVPGIDVNMDTLLAGMALESDVLATGNRAKVERDLFLEKSNCFVPKKGELKKVDVGEGCRTNCHFYMCRR